MTFNEVVMWWSIALIAMFFLGGVRVEIDRTPKTKDGGLQTA